ncbi:MAG: LemA family protein [Thermodesulfovibrionales bacterium]|jgi:LemA protein
MFIFSLILIGLILLPFVVVIILYNRLVRMKNMMSEAWSGIDVQLTRRYDLIPNLVETVKGYMNHEQKLFSDIADLRSRAIGAGGVREKGAAETALTQGLRTLFAVAEAYPELKANQNFLELQKSMADIEEQLQLARRYYNGSARDYNISVESFPGNMVASLFGFKAAEFFEIEEPRQREVPQVKF